MSRSLRSTLLALVLALGIAGLGSPAAAVANSFTGNCLLTGTVTFSPAIGITPVTTTEHADVKGTCSGKLVRDGVTTTVSSAPSTYVATLIGAGATCAGGTATGSGTLTVAGTPVSFALTEVRVAAVSYLKPVGTNLNEVSYLQPSVGVSAIQACASRGLAGGPINTHLQSLAL